jgi:hypothetical protein
MILTRYLYAKPHVEYSLVASVQAGTTSASDPIYREEAKFWATELYFSGFQGEAIELTGGLIELLPPKYSQIARFLQTQITELRANPERYWILGTITENVAIRMTTADFPKHVAIVMRECDMKQYKTKPVIEGKSWKIPRRACIYPLRLNPALEPVSRAIYDNWIFWASFSPIWKSRIDKHHGTKTHEILFEDEDDFESFHNWHDYEPDEQPREVWNHWCGAGGLPSPLRPPCSREGGVAGEP